MNVSLILGAAAGLLLASPLLLPRGDSPPRWSMVARWLLVAAWIALMIVDVAGDHRILHTPTYRAIALASMAGAALFLLNSAVRNWRDDDALAEDFGPRDGYIEWPHRLSSRARAALYLLFMAAMLALTAALALQTPFSPE